MFILRIVRFIDDDVFNHRRPVLVQNGCELEYMLPGMMSPGLMRIF